jgi:hypothetical protein
MPVTSLHIQGSTRVERHAVVDIVEEAIHRSGGWILDFHQFSNISLVLELEVPPRHLHPLLERLQEGGIAFRPCPELPPEEADDAVIGTLQITFVHQEPDLRMPTPPLVSRSAEPPRLHGAH